MTRATLKWTELIPAPQVGIASPSAGAGRDVGPLPADAGISRDLIKAMAMDAGKSLCAYLEVMFPEVWHGQNSRLQDFHEASRLQRHHGAC